MRNRMTNGSRHFRGTIASRGLAIGPAAVIAEERPGFSLASAGDPAFELSRLDQALDSARLELEEIRQDLEAQGATDRADIIDVQILFLLDETCKAKAAAAIHQGTNAEAAWMGAMQEFAERIGALPNPTLAERAADVRDAGHRVLGSLQGKPYQPQLRPVVPSIILARDLAPSQTATLDPALVLGFCTAEGGPTSHTAIFARALGLPALVGLGEELLDIASGSMLVLDAQNGELVLDPPREAIEESRSRAQRLWAAAEGQLSASHAPAVTLDGHQVEVFANIGGPGDVKAAIENGAEGIGLLRTEFLFLQRNALPAEDEQFEAYASILSAFGDRPVILRTADIGGDKALPYLQLPPESNPFLGVRGLRLALARPRELLEPQLRAALRAGHGHNLRIMFPMVTSLAEVREAREAVRTCTRELLAAGRATADTPQVGIMIEVPAAAIMADVLAPEVDFFSIGTNDLTQYVLAADRTNAQAAAIGSAHSPAVLRLLQNVITQAHRHGKRVGVCGELAGEPIAIPILLGLGLDEFSMNSQAIPAAKDILRNLRLTDCEALAEAVLNLESDEQVESFVLERFPALAGSR